MMQSGCPPISAQMMPVVPVESNTSGSPIWPSVDEKSRSPMTTAGRMDEMYEKSDAEAMVDVP
eukprot:scaffold142089_cov32-Tisochrysis_lutea.AAC.4